MNLTYDQTVRSRVRKDKVQLAGIKNPGQRNHLGEVNNWFLVFSYTHNISCAMKCNMNLNEAISVIYSLLCVSEDNLDIYLVWRNFFTCPEGPLGVESNAEMQNNWLTYLRICGCWVLSPMWNRCINIPPCQGSEIILEEGWKEKELEHGEESCEMPSSGHGVAATFQLPATLDTCTGASQQDQPPSQ